MKISLNWLRRYVDVDWDAETIAERLTAAGTEVEGFERVRADFTGVRVGRVTSVRQHPDADRLRLATVDLGDSEQEVVCGAANCRADITVAYAGVGAVLPGNFKIKRAKIRGVISLGMLCAESELGISEAGEGIMELASDLPLGASLVDALPIEDVIFDVGVTANRGDCFGHIGVARELAALAGVPLKRPPTELARLVAGTPVPVTIEDADRCARYVGRVMKGVAIEPSPFWMQQLLRAVGVRPINNVVDVTNFVLFEYGQPLHAFDLRDLAGPEIRIRRANEGEVLVTLDDQPRTLTTDDLLICDGAQPVALAGVMGGQNSEVKADTQDLMIEAAWFAPSGVRETSRRLNVRSESSHRFERSVDPEATREAADRALHLLLNLPGGAEATVLEAFSDVQARPVERPVIHFDPAETTRLLGVALPLDQQREALSRFGFVIADRADGTWDVATPSHRGDVAESADLVEEVIRYVGYGVIPDAAPRIGISGAGEGHRRRRQQRRLEGYLNARGFHQALNFSFLGADLLAHFDQTPPLRLVNPLTEELAVLRTSVIPKLVMNARHNQRHGAGRIALFESGQIFAPTEAGTQPAEQMSLGIVCAGEAARHWQGGARPFDFYDLKGLIEDLLRMGGLPQARFTPVERSWLHPGASAEVWIGDVSLGVLGALHPTLERTLDVAGVFAAELALAPLLAAQAGVTRFAEFSRQPSVRRDLALVIKKSVKAGQVLASIEELAVAIVDTVEVFDVYEGGDLAADERSLGVSVTYRAEGRTLTDEDVGAAQSQLTLHLGSAFDARQR
jgi:phenylalanyl-tRNA synthetase beta chain